MSAWRTGWMCSVALLLTALHTGVARATTPQDRLYGLATCVESLREGSDRQQEALYQDLQRWFETDFRVEGTAFMPCSPSSVLGFPLVLVNPAGAMVPGFMVVLEAPLEQVRTAVEQREGKPFTDCGHENCPYAADSPKYDAAFCQAQRVQSCERELRPKHTLVITRADDRQAGRSLTILACMGHYVP